eukprot:TRINITY_DN2300_c0_g1_i1.p1 TRINITY_DN2300_c0_g1~~TRINITY_DN2300_c0_g1_i1.p1  ORF type:complete len:516 (+),score=106.09 TRINITY_DN2300_c0_g1_i1:2776-4323(+)
MIDQSLKMSEGVTPDVFNPPEAAAAGNELQDENKEEKDDQNKEESKVEAKVDATEIKNVVYRPEVTREGRMKYFKVPRLGCYLAVPLIYSSCLFAESLDTALTEYATYREKVKRNEELTKEYEDKLAQAKAEQEEDAGNQSIDKSKENVKGKKGDKHNSKPAPEPEQEEGPLEPPKLEEVKEPEYQTKPLSYVICLDTLGQDREFTSEQKAFVLETIKKYKQMWEENEKARLTSDRKLKEEEKEKDTEFNEKLAAGIQEEEDKVVDEKVAVIPEDVGEEEKRAREKLIRWEHKVKQITSGPLKDKVLELNKYNVVKMTRIMQTLFYLLGFKREDLCEPETNKLFWKKARKIWNEGLLDKFQEYTPVGPKEGQYKKYQKINFLEKNLEGITEEDVKNYSLGLSKLFISLQMALEIRKEDILRRKAKREALMKEREEAIQKSEQRDKERAEELKNKKEETMNVWYFMQESRLGKSKWRRRRLRRKQRQKPQERIRKRRRASLQRTRKSNSSLMRRNS